MPDALPVLPLRETVVFPLTIAPISVERSRARGLIEDVMAGERRVALVAIRASEPRPPRPEDLYAYGTAALVHDALTAPDDVLRVAVEGTERVRIVGWVRTRPYLVARVQWLPDLVEEGAELDALVQTARHLFLRFVSLVNELSGELAQTVHRVTDPRQLVYLLASTTPMTTEARQQLLEQPSTGAKLRQMITQLEHDIGVRELMRRIARKPSRGAGGGHADAPVPRNMPSFEEDLRETAAPPPESPDLRAQVRGLALPDTVRKEVDRELERLERTPASSPEHAMIRTYLDWVIKLPWGRTTGKSIDVAVARDVLDADHYGLPEVKARILEYLAVRKLRADRGIRDAAEDAGEREPILCLVGPPGVGKTLLGQSIAHALSRRFARVALGGIHDEAEIRGHRRTYIGAMPGRILQALARAGAADPVFMLDEIDKLGVGFHGNPAAALLEVLDGAHNRSFVDSYLGAPFDLSRVLFVCTANGLDTIPAPLLDRMETITLTGYTDAEKIFIARRHLLPRAVRAHGLRPAEIAVDDDAIARIIRGYTREAGVRGLSREVASVLRKTARIVSESANALAPIHVTDGAVADYLGPPRFVDEACERIERPGVATGLAWTPAGGDLLFVEATIVSGDDDLLVLTGMLGNVMRESAQAALSYLRSNGERFGIEAPAFARKTVHVHVPAGAIPKDGPSAGVTIVTALASQATGRIVRSDLAMTGEITLRGRVLPVGGIRDKVLAAHRAGLRVVIFPRRCEAQLEGIPDEVRAAIELVPVESIDEVLFAALLPVDEAHDRVTLPMQEPSRVSVH
jgi:ATP-dependent Lon protease